MENPPSQYKLPEPIRTADDEALEREYHVCSILFGLSLITALVLGCILWA
ncbi:MAG: hypothetical protein AAGH40_08590 [Verrucomicrobiota bacterium]